MYINYKDGTAMVSSITTPFSGGVTHETEEEDIILCECTYIDGKFYKVHQETNEIIQQEIQAMLDTGTDRDDTFINNMKELQSQLLIKTNTLIVSKPI